MRAKRRRSTDRANRRRWPGLALGIGALACMGLIACGGGERASPESQADAAAAMEATSGDTGAAADTAPEGMADDGALLDPNRASPAALRGLSGLTESAATAILDGRPFPDMVALDSALAGHLDEGTREALYRRMWIPLDLNAASDREILLIPGVGDRMLGEFKEYRPYRAMEQFRREIGKYVSDEELARLERYVRLEGG